MTKQWSLQEAKSRFSEVVNIACSGLPQLVTKRGREAVVIVSFATYQQLLRHNSAEPVPFRDLLLPMPQADEEFDFSEYVEPVQGEDNF